MKKVGIGVLCILLIGALAVSAMAVGQGPTGKGKGGFDEYGYNYKARIFNGLLGNYDGDDDPDTAGGLDDDVTTIDGEDYIVPVPGTHLVMKWNKAWDEARFGGGEWTAKAWVTNHDTWVDGNGKTHTAYYRIEWTGPGSELWGQFTITRAIYDGQKIR